MASECHVTDVAFTPEIGMMRAQRCFKGFAYGQPLRLRLGFTRVGFLEPNFEMTSSGITADPLRTAALLVRAAEGSSEVLDPELEALLAPYASAASAVDWEPVVRELGRSLRASRDALAVAEAACDACNTALLAAQQGRERAVATLQHELTALRTAVDAIFGAQGLQKMKLGQVMPGDPTALLRMAGMVRDGLTGLSGFPALRRGIALNIRLHAAPLDRALYALSNSITEVQRAERALRMARSERERAHKDHEQRGRAAAEALAKLGRRAMQAAAGS
jgi:hypothetical protein